MYIVIYNWYVIYCYLVCLIKFESVDIKYLRKNFYDYCYSICKYTFV